MSAISASSAVGQLSLCFAPPSPARDVVPEGEAYESRECATAIAPSEEGPSEEGPSEEGFREALCDALGEPIAEVVLTDNRSRILSARATSEGLCVRVHRCFEQAPAHLIAPLAVLLGGGRGGARREALAAVRGYFADHATPRAARPVALRTQGQFLDLRVLCDEINRTYFDGALDVEITWGRRAPRRRGRRKSRSVRLGSWDQQRRLVRIHPVLDQRFVPRYVVASVVHHEMVHAALPSEVRGTRRLLHGPEFRRRERDFKDFERAERWIATHLDRLLRNAR